MSATKHRVLTGSALVEMLDLEPSARELLNSATDWLADHATAYVGAPTLGYFEPLSPEEALEQVARARAWERAKHEAGWGGLDLPVELGGRGRTPLEADLFATAEAAYDLPLEIFAITRGMVVPTLAKHAPDDLARGLVPAALRGEELFCQLFSEPGCGSDISAISTNAVPVDGGWRIRGQKVWTSRAQFANHGLLLARTDPHAPRRERLTMFVVPLMAEQVVIRPIRQLPGSSNFCEVYFDDLLIPDSARVGEIGQGFAVALDTLGFERAALAGKGVPWSVLHNMAGHDGATDLETAPKRAELEELRLAIAALRARTTQSLIPGAHAGPAGAAIKLLTSHAAELSNRVVLDALGPDAAYAGPLVNYAVGTFGTRTGGGTEDILRNTIAERLLGLPRA